MKTRLTCALALALALAACSSEAEVDHSAMGHDGGEDGQSQHSMPLSDKAKKDKKEAAELLVARFEVNTCADADLLASARRTSPEEGETMTRVFRVAPECAQGTVDTLNEEGFEELEAGLYTSDAGDDDAEQVSIVMPDESVDGTTTLEWKTVQE